MGLIKSEIFATEVNQIAQYAKALGHPARVAILQHLHAQQKCVCGDLVDQIGLAQATISQHLRELKNVGLIQGTIEGTSVCYCIDPVGWASMQQTMKDLLKIKPKKQRKCC